MPIRSVSASFLELELVPLAQRLDGGQQIVNAWIQEVGIGVAEADDAPIIEDEQRAPNKNGASPHHLRRTA
jgi:hypothetical protein